MAGITSQAQSIVNALRELGIPRREFKVYTRTRRITDRQTGARYTQYEEANLYATSPNARQVIAKNAQALADQFLSVTLIRWADQAEGEAASVLVTSDYNRRQKVTIITLDRVTDKVRSA